jgi:DNA-3-methyladenine glycosylase I
MPAPRQDLRTLDGRTRCGWPGDDPLYVAYHDTEWGVPVHDDQALFAKLVLDGFQAGLAWITILRKRDAFLRVFEGFDPARLARWTARDVARALADPGIVRHRGKVEGAVKNARAWLALAEAGTPFGPFLWAFVGGAPKVNRHRRLAEVPAQTPESEAMSKALRKAGFTFVGPTICYAFMQAVGMVDDHLVGCFRHGIGTGGARPARRR